MGKLRFVAASLVIRKAGEIGRWLEGGLFARLLAILRDLPAGRTPEQIADQLEERFVNYGADGFNIMSPTLPGGLTDFIELVLPELRRRGLFRTEYTGTTLREHLGLRRPAGRFSCQAAAAARCAAARA